MYEARNAARLEAKAKAQGDDPEAEAGGIDILGDELERSESPGEAQDAMKSGYEYVDIVGHAITPDGSTKYLVSYLVGGAKTILLWEPASTLSNDAIAAYEARQSGFSYTAEEEALLKQCGESSDLGPRFASYLRPGR